MYLKRYRIVYSMESALSTRIAVDRSLHCWNSHKKYLTLSAMKYINDEKFQISFTNWVINGDNAPQFGDELFDQIYSRENNLLMNRYFMYKTYEYGHGKYKNCILRKKIDNHAIYDRVETIVFNQHELSFQIDSEIIYL